MTRFDNPDRIPRPRSPVPPSARWPGAVVRPGSPRFEQSAKDWLFDLAPVRWRHEQVFHRNPLELARVLRLYLDADVLAMQAGLRALSCLPADSRHHRDEDTAVGVCIREHSWAKRARDQVRLVEEALLGGYRPSV